MPTTTPLTDAINALTTYANETTGAGDTTLSEAVATLVAGYGQGGGTTAEDGLVTRSLTYYENSRVTSIGNNVFRDWSGLTNVYFPLVTSIGADAFNTSKLTYIDDTQFPSVTYIGSQAFRYSSSVQRVHLSNLHNSDGTGLAGLTNCLTVVLPSFDGTGKNNNEFLYNNNKMTGFDSSVKRIFNYFFRSCSALTTVVLRSTTLAWMSNANAFQGTKFVSGGAGGTIYIPKVLYDHLGDGSSSDYKAATNWSTYDGYGTITWAKIEGSQYENYYVDGTPIE